MTTTETRPQGRTPTAQANGEAKTKKTRTPRKLDAASAASKIAAVLKGLDVEERNKAMKILAVLTDSAS